MVTVGYVWCTTLFRFFFLMYNIVNLKIDYNVCVCVAEWGLGTRIDFLNILKVKNIAEEWMRMEKKGTNLQHLYR